MRQTSETESLTKSPASSSRQSVAQHSGGCDGAGDLDGLPVARPADPAWFPQLDARIQSRISVQDGRCWIWSGSRGSAGYGQVNRGGRKQLAHRYMYNRFVGEIPADLECDHLCWVRACVNPNHIDLVTHRTNKRRQLLSIVVSLRHMRNLIATSDNVRSVPLKLTSTYSELNGPSVPSGVMLKNKSCLICRKFKPLSDFYTINDEGARGRVSYPSSYCKPCHSAKCAANQRIRRAKNKELRNV